MTSRLACPVDPLSLNSTIHLVGAPLRPGALRVLPMRSGDRGRLLTACAADLDALYPRGSKKLAERLDDVAAGGASCLVAWRHNQPVGFAVDTPKGLRAAKLSTLWIAEGARGTGVGAPLVAATRNAWIRRGVERGWGTARINVADPLVGLGRPFGFCPETVAVNRYGLGEDELILGWQASRLTDAIHETTHHWVTAA